MTSALGGRAAVMSVGVRQLEWFARIQITLKELEEMQECDVYVQVDGMRMIMMLMTRHMDEHPILQSCMTYDVIMPICTIIMRLSYQT